MVKADDYQPGPGPLTEGEQAVLAREVATDGRANQRDYQFRCPECSHLFFDSVAVDTIRGAFTDGWDAALVWVGEQRGQS